MRIVLIISFRYILQVRLRRLLFFFNDTATTEIYTLSLHDALPILQSEPQHQRSPHDSRPSSHRRTPRRRLEGDRKSTRLNSSHTVISYAVFCLKKKKHIVCEAVGHA